MPSFDFVSQVELQEVDNAVNQSIKEIGNRYDFKGSKCSLEQNEMVITATGDDNYKLEQVVEILKTRLVRRKVDTQALEFGSIENASGGLVRQTITIRQGVDQDNARKIVKKIKDAKIKVQAAIQGDLVRVTGKKRDDLQKVIALVKGADIGLPLQTINFRN
ncbi:MAG: YajQ family cyclic di-GMP-binding protein [Magnetococcales bacterium]|nr:YajQ family cyclic di-GMP-binding protein [Magnetococcales bacterium]